MSQSNQEMNVFSCPTVCYFNGFVCIDKHGYDEIHCVAEAKKERDKKRVNEREGRNKINKGKGKKGKLLVDQK